jgi:hypothetical protein
MAQQERHDVQGEQADEGHRGRLTRQTGRQQQRYVEERESDGRPESDPSERAIEGPVKSLTDSTVRFERRREVDW